MHVRASISSIVYLRDGGDPYGISPDAKGSAYRPTIMPISEETIRGDLIATRLRRRVWSSNTGVPSSG